MQFERQLESASHMTKHLVFQQRYELIGQLELLTMRTLTESTNLSSSGNKASVPTDALLSVTPTSAFGRFETVTGKLADRLLQVAKQPVVKSEVK